MSPTKASARPRKAKTNGAAPIPLLDLKGQHAALRAKLYQAAKRVLDSGVFILGPEGRAFEAEFARASGARFCAGVSSGTDALRLALEACGVGPGDEVAVPAFTFVATATVVTSLGAKPVFVDVREDGTLDPEDLPRRLTPRTIAVLPVHLYGRAADMDPILALARQKGLRVVEDCAQAHLARYKGRPVGTLGEFGAFSFYPSKNLGALGDAGALTTQEETLFSSVVTLRNAGRLPGVQYDHPRVGHNCRLDELQAAFLRVKLERLAAWTAARRALANRYLQGLAGLPLGLPPAETGGDRHSWHVFTVRTPRRDELAEHLKSAGIGTAVYYPKPLHLMGAYRDLGHAEGDFPGAERAAREVLALPLYPELKPASADRVIRAVRAFFENK